MKKFISFLIVMSLLISSLSCDALLSRAEDFGVSGTAIEAEDGQILFGKLTQDEEASGGISVKLGEDKPAGVNPGIYWYVNAAEACTTTITIEYSSGAGLLSYFYCNNYPLPDGTGNHPLTASSNGEKQAMTYNISLQEGKNELVLLCFADVIAVDRIILNTNDVTLMKESPNVIDAENDITHYYSKDAKVHMGQIAPNEYSISQNCVIYTKNNNGYVNFDNVYSEAGGYYQLILFCAAASGSNIKVSVNGQDYTVPVYLPLGWGAFTDVTTGARTHAVVNCNLKSGNNQIIVSCVDNDVCIDMLQVARLDNYARYEAENTTIVSPVFAVTDPTVSGTGFVAGINDVNAEVRFTVNVTESGKYSLCARYYASADMNGTTEPTYRVYTDQGYYGEISLKNDGTTWQVATMDVSLKAGENEIIIKNGNGDAYLDYLGVGAKIGDYQNSVDQQSGIDLEAEDGQILFGKLMREESASAGLRVKLGKDTPTDRTSGIVSKVSSKQAQSVPITISYLAEQDAVVNVVTVNNTGAVAVQSVKLPANQTKESLDLVLSEGENTVQLLYASGNSVTIDKIVMHAKDIQVVTEAPLKATDKDTIYFSRNARVHMGNIVGADNSVSTTCVSELVHKSGNGYVEFSNVYSENGGNYQLIVFCAAEDGSKLRVSVNGKDYTAPVNLAMGKNVFADASDARSHAVVNCELYPGDNQVVVQGVDDADVKIDALMVTFQSASTQNWFDTKKGTAFEAENGQIVFGKIENKKSASGGITVKLGEDTPEERSSGIFWNTKAEVDGEVSVIVECSAKEDTQLLFFNNDSLQATLNLSAGEEKACFNVKLSKGDNKLALLYSLGGAVAIDRIVLNTKKIEAVTEEPLKPAENALLYFTRNARIHMGNIVGSETSISATCVSELVHKSGNGYVEFNNIYSETGGYYQLIVFCAAEEGKEVLVSVNGEEYTAAVNLPMGKDIFANAKDARSHAVVICKLNPGNNQVVLRSVDNADIQFDSLMATFLSNNTRYEAEDAEVTDAVIKGKGQEYDYGTYSGTGFVGSIDLDSSQVSFTVTVEEDGEYEIGICYSTGITDTNMRPTYRVYTQNGYYDEVIMPNVTGWGNFSLDTLVTTKVSLKAGENEIIIKKGKLNAELDYIEIGERVGEYKEPIEEPSAPIEVEDEFGYLEADASISFTDVLPILIGIILVFIVLGTTIIVRKKRKGEINEKMEN